MPQAICVFFLILLLEYGIILQRSDWHGKSRFQKANSCLQQREREKVCKQIFIHDPAKQLAMSALGQYLNVLKDQVASGLERCMRHPVGDEPGEMGAQEMSIIQELQKYPQSDKMVAAMMVNAATAFDQLQPDPKLGRNANMVGCRLRAVFAWADWNGFTSMLSVRQYIENNPGSHLEDEDGIAVSWADFERLAGVSA